MRRWGRHVANEAAQVLISGTVRTRVWSILGLLAVLTTVGVSACAGSSEGSGVVTSRAISTTTAASPESATTTASGVFVLGEGVFAGLVYPDLPGMFPSSVETGDQILHLRKLVREVSSQGLTFQTDFWQQSSTGRFRTVRSVFDDGGPAELRSVLVFTGERVKGYEPASGQAALDLPYGVVQEIPFENRIEPFSNEWGPINEAVLELRQAVADGLLRETGRGQAGGQEVVCYEGVRGEGEGPTVRRVVLADAATGLPLDDRSYREDGVLHTCWLADLEVVSEDEAGSLFDLDFPAGVEPVTTVESR